MMTNVDMSILEDEVLYGWEIPTRSISKSERGLEITWERFREFHYLVGEDFLDQTNEGDIGVFGGWLMHKYPFRNLEILSILNHKTGILDFNEIDIFSYDKDKDINHIYVEFAEFCNKTVHLKTRVNMTLILFTEHYK